jgi:hypothetical protein
MAITEFALDMKMPMRTSEDNKSGSEMMTAAAQIC